MSEELREGTVWQRFRRITATTEYIAPADGLRLLAVLLVLGHHVAAHYLSRTHRLGANRLPEDWAMLAGRDPLIHWILHLAMGVPLFCVISGLVLTIPFVRGYEEQGQAPSWRLYLLRRLIRLEPPYVLNMLVMFLVLLVPKPGSETWTYVKIHTEVFFPHLVASLTYLHGQIYKSASWLNGVAWTLEIEVQFYLLLPLIAMIFRWKNVPGRRWVLLGMIGCSALLAHHVIYGSGHPRLELSLLVQLHFFLAGVLLADLYVRTPEWMRWSGLQWDVVTLGGAAGFVYVLHWRGEVIALLPYLLMIFCLGATRGRWSCRVFGSPLAALLGGISYTTYLYHDGLVRALLPLYLRLFPGEHALWVDLGVVFAVLTPPVLAATAVLYLYTERPFLLLSRRVMRRYREAEERRRGGAAA